MALGAVDTPLLPLQSLSVTPIKNANWDLLPDSSDLWRQLGCRFCWWESASFLLDVFGHFAGSLHTFSLFFTQSNWTMNLPPVSSGPGLFSFKELIQISFAHFHDNWANSAEHLIRRENSWSKICILNRVIESLHCSKSASLRRRCSQRSSTQTKQTKKENGLSFFFPSLSLRLKITLIIECIMVCPWERRFSSEWRPTAHLLLMLLWEAVVSIIIYSSICRSTPLHFELWNWQSWTLPRGRLRSAKSAMF